MDSEDNTGADDAPEADGTSAGAQLRAAREAMRLDLAHVAAETRIPLRHLEAIEAGDFESLPSRTYAIGFSRTFARAVGLDEAVITEAVRAELADGTMRRSEAGTVMEPGEPAKLPSPGLAWAGAFAALLLAVGAIAFFNAYFGAGTQPGSLLRADAARSAATTAAAPSATVPAPVPDTGGEVVLTATDDGVWLRLYEASGERLVERTLQQGETLAVPAAAADPRINTGRPDALAITIGGKSVARLSDRAVTMANAPVSAAALLARAEPAPPPPTSAPAAAASPTTSATSRPVTLRSANTETRSVQRAATSVPESAAPAPAPAAQTAPAATAAASASAPTSEGPTS